jgi:creatinine amidohydrolase
MLKTMLGLTACLTLSATVCAAQTRPASPPLSPKWEDLSSAEFVKAIQKADGVCMLPMGSVESFGPTAPLGTNVYLAKLISLEAAKQEFAVIFPDYFVSNTTNTSHLAGAIRYSQDMQLRFLDETTREMARNGCRKIILANGHTGNLPVINLSMGNFAAEPHDYAVYTYYVSGFPVGNPNQLPPAARVSAPGMDGHGGEERVAAMLAYHPELIHLERAHDEAFEPGHGAEDTTNPPPAGAMREIPTGYSGDASGATAARGHALVDFQVARVVKFIQSVKADKATLAVQKEFYQRTQKPQAPPPAKK